MTADQSAPLTPDTPDPAVTEGDVEAINVVFDGPPSHESGRFVEVETDDGKGIRVGEWIERPDGMWALRIPTHAVGLDAARERVRVVEGERDAAEQERDDWRYSAQGLAARTESAEAAHAALVAGVEALADEIDAGVVAGLGGDRSMTLANISAELRALLGGGAS